jgi:hypothetical protein
MGQIQSILNRKSSLDGNQEKRNHVDKSPVQPSPFVADAADENPSTKPFVDIQGQTSHLCKLANREMARLSEHQSFLTRDRNVLNALSDFMDYFRSQACQAQDDYITFSTTENLRFGVSIDQDHLHDVWDQLRSLLGALLSAKTISLNSPNKRKGWSRNINIFL